MKRARLYVKENNKKVRCTACEWKCLIDDGNSGICGVRANVNGELYGLVYGQVNDAYADWIEKKKLAHVLPGSMAFSIGTIGCNFGCDYCCNWQTSQGSKLMREDLRKRGALQYLNAEIASYGYTLSPQKVVEYCKRKKYRIIAYTYNEPTVFVEYALDIAQRARKEGIRSVFVTNGFMSEESVELLSQSMDAIAIDIKAFRPEFYRKHCKAKIDPIFRNIELFVKAGIWVELTTLLIPDENDSEKEIQQIAEYIAGVDHTIPWHITQFTPDYKLLDKPRTSSSVMYRAFEIAKKAGLDYVYFGNLWDSDKTSTHCPHCGITLVFRDVYTIRLEKAFDKNGACSICGENIPGIWT